MDVVAELKKGFEDFKAKQKEADEKVLNLIKELRSGTDEGVKTAKDLAEKATKEVTDIANRLVEAEQKLVEGYGKGKPAPLSVGELLVKSEEYKLFAKGKSRNVSIEVPLEVFNNTIIGQTSSPQSNEDTLVPSQYVPGIIPGAFRMLRVKDLIPQGQTTSNIVLFTRELSFTNAAAETKEGGTKPESTLTFEQISVPIVTIAHFLKVSKQIRDDAPAVVSYVNTRLRYGVNLREDTQIIAGDGVGQNMSGMTKSGNFTAFTPTTGDNALDSLNKAKYAIIASDYQPTGIIMNPADWGAIERLKVGSSDNRYIIGDPRSPVGPSLWGLPVVVTNSIGSGNFLMAAFDIAYMYWNRQETMVEIFEQDDTNVQKNLLTIRSEKRGALAAYTPAATRYGALTQ